MFWTILFQVLAFVGALANIPVGQEIDSPTVSVSEGGRTFQVSIKAVRTA